MKALRSRFESMSKKPKKRLRKKHERSQNEETIRDLQDQLGTAQQLAANSRQELAEVAIRLATTEQELVEAQHQHDLLDVQAEAELHMALLRHHSSEVEKELLRAREELEEARASLDLYERAEEAERKLDEALEQAHQLSGPAPDLECERLVSREMLVVAADLAVKQASRHDRQVAVIAFEPSVKSEDSTLHALVGKRLATVIRDSDLFARLSSRSYGVLISEQTAQEEMSSILDLVAGRLTRVLNEPTLYRGQPLLAGVALGVSIAPWDAKSGEELVVHSEIALGEATDDGLPGLHFFKEGFGTLFPDPEPEMS